MRRLMMFELRMRVSCSASGAVLIRKPKSTLRQVQHAELLMMVCMLQAYDSEAVTEVVTQLDPGSLVASDVVALLVLVE